MRKALPGYLGWDRFVDAWKPGYRVLTSRQKVRDRAQELLFQHHKDHFQDTPVPLLYHPKDSRKENIEVTIPGIDRREKLFLNNVVNVSIEAAEAAIQTEDWASATPQRCTRARDLRWKTPKGLDHRRLPPVVKPCIPRRVMHGVRAPARTGSLSPRGGF